LVVKAVGPLGDPTRSSRAPILARAGAHGAAQAPLAGYLALLVTDETVASWNGRLEEDGPRA
jgi:hypothetical protein